MDYKLISKEVYDEIKPLFKKVADYIPVLSRVNPK